MALQRAETSGTPPPLAAYGAVWLLTLACLLVVQLARVTEFPPIPFVIFFTIGTLLSAWLSRSPLPEGVRFAFGIADGALAFLCLMGQSFLNSLLGVGQDNAIESYLSLSFLWYLCLRSALMVSMSALVFQCVPALALFGLVATYMLAAQILWLFALALLATLFLMLASHRLEWGRGATGLETGYALRTVLISGALAGLTALLLAPLLALTVGQLVAHFVVGMPLRANMRMAQQGDMPPDLQAGAGAVALSKAEVLRVRIEGFARPQYLRIESYNTYTGRGWNRGRFWMQPMLRISDGMFTVRRQRVPSESLIATATVRLSNGWHRSLYLPGDVIDIEAPVRQLYHSPITEAVIAVRSLGGGESYVARGYVPTDDPRILRRASLPDDSRLIENLRYYLPENLRRPRLQELALALTRNQPTQYDKVMALVRYIEQTTAYNLNTEAYPPEVDVAEHFLFEAKQGYCVEFATALAVLCLHANIPARVASGFILSETDPDTGEYIVREEHRHLWTEVYFSGVGWVAFDATRNAPVIEAGASAQQNAAADDAAQARRQWLQRVLNLLIAATLLTMLYLLVAPRLSWGRTETSRAAQLYQRLRLALWLLEIERPAPGQSPRAYLAQAAEALAQRDSAVGARLHALIPHLMTYFYGAPDQSAALEPEIQRQTRQILRQSLQEVGALGLIRRLATLAREKLYGR
ncbi:MAG: transglutaminase-like domain-containing protein [Fimbriimonadales bacterium]|nr:transglutaminase-like domain-containing protein [Fimbriimonadales bacterium]